MWPVIDFTCFQNEVGDKYDIDKKDFEADGNEISFL